MVDKKAVVSELNAGAEKHDFEGVFRIVRENQQILGEELKAMGIRDVLKKSTDDRLLLSFVDGVEFGARPLADSLMRLEKLVSFQPNSLVLSKAWGLGKIRKLDYFYRRVTVDFKTKKGHQFTYAAAADMLESAPENHILVFRERDPQAFEAMLRERPGDFVKEVLKSYGDMPVVRLEDVCIQNGFVKSMNWKKFWEGARAALRADQLVEIPAKRADSIRLKQSVEDYGDSWLTAFSHETDPKLILAAVREYVAQGKFASCDESVKTKIGERLAFAVTAARNVDDALYARLACQLTALGFATPSADEMREYLRERRRYIKAAAALPAREVGAMIAFLDEGPESRARLCAAVPEFCYAAVCELVERVAKDAASRRTIARMMDDPKNPKAPATLTTLVVGSYEKFKDAWPEMPRLITLLSQAIALGEGRQSGETLKMQNIIRRLFTNVDWLKKIFGWLAPAEQALFFERFQASIAWDPSTHHTIVVRMTRLVPELESHVVKVEKKREYARITSYRSFALRKQEYLKLINEEMPANVKRIEFAKSYGDLSENAEYQYAKDEQRALMQKQTLMQADLEAVKPNDFADATVDEVMPGVTVVIETKDGEKTWTILGEWDNDLDRGIISSKTRVAQNMLGKKPGDDFELPDAEGGVSFAKVKEIRPLSDEIREWMKLPAGMQI